MSPVIKSKLEAQGCNGTGISYGDIEVFAATAFSFWLLRKDGTYECFGDEQHCQMSRGVEAAGRKGLPKATPSPSMGKVIDFCSGPSHHGCYVTEDKKLRIFGY